MIPQELILRRQWVNWRYEYDAEGKPTKTPYNPLTARHVDVTTPEGLLDYQTVIAAMATGHYSGIGFALLPDDPYCFIDLDSPGDDYAIAERHFKILQMMDSYAEWSPSGKGMHIIVRGHVDGGRKRAKVEIYSDKRYMTMTGNTFMDKPIVDRMDILPAFHAELGKTSVLSVVKNTEQTLTDYEVFARMIDAANGEKVLSIWNLESHGEGGDGSHSAGDQALINYLQFYTHNAEQIKRMFLASPRAGRLVTGEKKKYAKYIPDMIKKSFDRELPEIDFSALKAVQPDFKKLLDNPLKAIVVPPPPAIDLKAPPGLVGEIMEYIYAQAPLAVNEFALFAALGLMAGICGRAYNVSDEGLNLYMLVLAPTGVGKESMAKGIDKLMSKVAETVPASETFRGPAEIASGPALTKYLKDHLSCFSLLGEFGLRLHQMCNEQAQSHMVGLHRVLLDMFHKSGKGSEVRPHIYSEKDKNTDVLYSPAYTILGESTPETFYRHLDESMISDGLLPRFLTIEYKGDRNRLSKTFRAAVPSQSLLTKMGDLCNYSIQLQHSNRVLPCSFTPEGEKFSDDLSERYRTLINGSKSDPVARQLYNRAHIKIMKLAALVAVGIHPMYPTITVDNLEWARVLVDTDIQNVLSRFQDGRVGRETGELNQIVEMTRVIHEYMQKPFDKTLEKMKVNPMMKHANIIPFQYIQRQCACRAPFRQDRMGASIAINRTIQTLSSEGALREIKSHVLLQEFNASMRAYAIIDPAHFV